MTSIGSIHRDIARSMAWTALFVFLGKLAGAVKEIAVAARFGTSEVVDAYVFVMSLNTWPLAVWLSVLTVIIVPLAARISAEAPLQLPKFRSETLGLGLVVSVALWALAWAAVPGFLASSHAALPLATQDQALKAVPVLSLQLLLGVFIGLLSAWTIAANRQVNTLLEGVPALVIAAALMLIKDPDLDVLVVATIVGLLVHLICLAASSWMRGETITPSLAFQSPHWGAFFLGFGVILGSQVLMSFTNIIDQLFAVRVGAGSVATLGYANKIVALIIGLGATAVTRATLPIFSRTHASAATVAERGARMWVLVLVGAGFACVALVWPLSSWIVQVLFERGAFTSTDTAAVAEVVRFGTLQLPFYFGGLVMVALLASQGRHRMIAAGAVVSVALKLCGNVLLVPHLGVSGIALSTAFMYVGAFLLLGWAVGSRQRGREHATADPR